MEDLFLLRIHGKNGKIAARLSNEAEGSLKEKASRYDPRKTFSTRGGNLILFAEKLYEVKKRKKRKQKKAKKSEFDEILFEGTCEDLADSILKFGDVSMLFY